MQQEKLKILKPTLRERSRYVKFHILSEEKIEYTDLEAAIWNTALDLYGETGVSKLSLWLVKNLYNEEKQIGVIRCNNNSVQQVLAALGMISRLGDNRVVFKILKVSGTIKGLGKD